ncbi:MAG TPA: hypothetical protein VMA34_17180 [Terracidiphilus sp.]|nr:hypothetical protein [Terracidiphilus sp.]
MVLRNTSLWEFAAGSLLLAAASAVGFWLVFRKRPAPEELERARRQFLVQSGRLVDGMLLDITEIEAPPPPRRPVVEDPGMAEDPRTLTLLIYNYRIGGVIYDCSQDITPLRAIVDPAQIRAGFPCTVRYQPGNPQNSIVLAEDWSGLRAGLPVLPQFADPDPLDTSHLHPRHTGRVS